MVSVTLMNVYLECSSKFVGGGGGLVGGFFIFLFLLGFFCFGGRGSPVVWTRVLVFFFLGFLFVVFFPCSLGGVLGGVGVWRHFGLGGVFFWVWGCVWGGVVFGSFFD